MEVELPLVVARALEPLIWTVPAGSPPVQVMSWPLARLTAETLAALVQVRAGGSVRFVLMGPTSLPPCPVIR
jgi:hypothetical protein